MLVSLTQSSLHGLLVKSCLVRRKNESKGAASYGHSSISHKTRTDRDCKSSSCAKLWDVIGTEECSVITVF